MQTSGYLGSAPQDRKTYVAQADRYATWVSTSVLQAYRRPQDPPPINGALLRQGDAQAVANDLGALWGVSQRAFEVTCPVEAALALDLGDYVNLTFPIADLANGQLGQIVGDRFNSEDSEVVFSVIGLRTRTVPLPGAVKNLAIVRTTDTSIDVRWDPVPGDGVRYQVMYRPVS